MFDCIVGSALQLSSQVIIEECCHFRVGIEVPLYSQGEKKSAKLFCYRMWEAHVAFLTGWANSRLVAGIIQIQAFCHQAIYKVRLHWEVLAEQ